MPKSRQQQMCWSGWMRTSSLALWLFLLVGEALAQYESSQCSDTNLTTYLRTESLLTNEMPILTLTELTLNQCAQKCSESEKGCHSFEYNAAKQSCALKLANAQPFGRSVLVPSTQPGIAFFQQICIPTKNLCAAPYSFERFPQTVLAGHAMEVVSVDSLSTCLRECLESRERMHLDCRSAMYYYETGQCILNREQRKTAPHLFSSDTKYQLVDYFENNCFDVSCPDGFNIHFVRMEDFEISPDKDVIMDGLTADECKKSCIENVVGSEVFPCKAYVYSSSKRECRLSAETGMIPQNSTKKSSGTGISSELSSISAGQYFEKFCLEGTVKCKETSFDLIPNRILDARDKVISTSSLSHCLQLCLMMAEDCNSVMFWREKDECVLNKKSQFSDPDLFHPAKKVDYFDNVCEYEVRPTKPLPEFAQDNDVEEQTTTKIKPMFKPDATQHQTIKHQDEPKKETGLLDTDCRLDGISVGARFDAPANGAIFIKDHSSTCRQVFENSTEAHLEIPFPSNTYNNPKCPGTELSPSLWSFIVVLQKNEIGIPSLMTGSDRVFNVTCDYSKISTVSTVSRDSKKSESIQDDTQKIGFDMESAPIPAAERIKMSILRNNRPVTTVSLGEELELRWTIDERARRGQDDELLGFLVEDCTAERMDGVAPEPAPLPLIVGGCPDIRVKNRLIRGPIIEIPEGFSTMLKVFRFDGSRRVRIRCSINICVEKCEPVNCEDAVDPNSTSASFGRRKRRRRQTIKELADLVEQYDQLKADGLVQRKLNQGEMIDQSTAQGSFTIIDEPESAEGKQVDKSLPETGQSLASVSGELDAVENSKCESNDSTTNNKLCLRRSLAIGLLIGLIVLGCSQLFVFVSWLQSRVLPQPDTTSSFGKSNMSTMGSRSSFGSYFEKDSIRWEHDRNAFSTLESPSTSHSRSSYTHHASMH